ncbi:MAG: DUF1987 domain-containing protein [Bacteroidetes bacterium]|nr:DUF1987 domain-containing protein [Bacteroidota bacterium]
MEKQVDIIDQTNTTPYVEFDYNMGTLKISGKIISENPVEFFDRLDSMLEKYIQQSKPSFVANIHLDYFNSVSSKGFLKFLRKIISSRESIDRVDINWFYQKDDIELKEAGEDYSFILQYPFNILEFSEKN